MVYMDQGTKGRNTDKGRKILEGLLCANYCVKHFTYIISFHNNYEVCTMTIKEAR